ncbi:hypothetical protein BWR60_14225 [Inquilinus limosus]|uniref:Uncharacterized protein n=1 Tax=Inquilinus limosus TaxID=171674 RepID=A0A211ZMJ0_9PROT|nr:hypothetical protein BWR60_14225 [Inquilinus limosus]
MTPLRLTRRHALEVGTGVAGLAVSGLARPAGAAGIASRRASRGTGTIPFIKGSSGPPPGGGTAAMPGRG